jgi:hypothetical protein
VARAIPLVVTDKTAWFMAQRIHLAMNLTETLPQNSKKRSLR